MTNREPAYGGVVFDAEGRVLLREPRGHFDGYVWTFPKGRPEAGETPAEAALRETLEETGVPAEIQEKIPGIFPGGITENVYFLMRPSGEAVAPGKETASLRWAKPEEARTLISETTNPTGKRRDLAVLEKALAVRLKRASRSGE